MHALTFDLDLVASERVVPADLALDARVGLAVRARDERPDAPPDLGAVDGEEPRARLVDAVEAEFGRDLGLVRESSEASGLERGANALVSFRTAP